MSSFLFAFVVLALIVYFGIGRWDRWR